MSDWRPLAEALAAGLIDDGALDPAWRKAFEQVPRHRFLPGQPIAAAYVNDAVVVQERFAEITGGGRLALPTASASQPGVMAAMLRMLDAHSGMRVLEVGTGTGYNAALLCHRLGDGSVTSVEIDPQLVETARTALAGLGFHPSLVVGDGYHGVPQSAPYDAILATCAVNHIPPAWIDQLAGQGRIVAPLAGGAAYAFIIVSKTADDEVTGRFGYYPAAFMPLRDQLDNPLPPGRRRLGFDGPRMPHYGTTDLDPHIVADAAADLLLFLHLHIPGLQVGTVDRDDGPTVNVTASGSYADARLTETSPGRWPTVQRGARRLWDTIEHAVRRWEELGKPPRDRFGISALDDADRQYVWLDDPDGPHSWPMSL